MDVPTFSMDVPTFFYLFPGVYYFDSSTYQVGAGVGYGGFGVGAGYSNVDGITISGGYGGAGVSYGLQTYKTGFFVSMDDRDLIGTYQNARNSRKYNGYGPENGNSLFKIVDLLGTVTAGWKASDNHDDGYRRGLNKADLDFGLFKGMVNGAIENISQPAGLVRAAVGLAISPLYYGAVAIGGGPAYRAAQSK